MGAWQEDGVWPPVASGAEAVPALDRHAFHVDPAARGDAEVARQDVRPDNQHWRAVSEWRPRARVPPRAPRRRARMIGARPTAPSGKAASVARAIPTADESRRAAHAITAMTTASATIRIAAGTTWFREVHSIANAVATAARPATQIQKTIRKARRSTGSVAPPSAEATSTARSGPAGSRYRPSTHTLALKISTSSALQDSAKRAKRASAGRGKAARRRARYRPRSAALQGSTLAQASTA